MRALSLRLSLLLPLVAPSCVLAAGQAEAPRIVQVQLPASAQGASGRLLLHAQRADAAEREAQGGKVARVDANPANLDSAALAGMDVEWLAPGQVLRMDADTQAYPRPFSQLPAGDYYLQATLDTARNDAYSGWGADNLSSAPVKVHLGDGRALPVLVLDQPPTPPRDPFALRPDASEDDRAAMAEAKASIRTFRMPSAALSRFWGREVAVQGHVALPPGYAGSAARYPVVYHTHGFGGTLASQLAGAARMYLMMRKGELPPMIWVTLDQSGPTGTHEFADSVNNGPWGTALTEELIPWLERQYRMDAKPSGRLLTGHSSGGWASAWLQVRYPKIFGGSWPTSPDPVDFHDFSIVDLYAPNANVYFDAAGKPLPLWRDHDKVVATAEQMSRMEMVQGPVGGQMASFEWVFSPRGADGRPMPLYNRITGKVDPQVAAYYRDHYDIEHLVRTQWRTLKPDLDGKLHLIMGDADTFYLDGAARLLQKTLRELGARDTFRFLPGKTHFDLFAVGDDRNALLRTIGKEMYDVARPGNTFVPKVPPTKPAAKPASKP